MPIVSIDWTLLLSRFDGRTKILALTDRQISMLSTLAEQLTWEKTFRVADYDWADKDVLDQEVHDLIRWLTMPVDLQEAISYIDDIETLLDEIKNLTAQSGCCNNTAPLADTYESPNAENYPDTPPATWGDGEPIADSADWQSLVCGAAHAYVDILKNTGSELDTIVKSGAIIIGGIAGILALASGAGILIAVAWTTASSIVAGLIAGATTATFEGTEQEIEDARADIVCAIVHGDADALEAAVQEAVSPLSWSLWFQMVPYETAWNTMIDGANDSGTLDVERRTDCACPVPTPQDHDQLAVSWLVTTTGDCNNGLANGMNKELVFKEEWPSDGANVWASAWNAQNANHSAGKRYVLRQENPPEGEDSLARDYTMQYAAGNWRETKEQHTFAAESSNASAGTIVLSNPKVFCDPGTGYDWFDASIETFVEKNTSLWSYSLANNTLTASWNSSGIGTDKWIKVTVRPLIPV